MGEKIKCIVWDLDNTIWDGILSEDANVKLNEKALEVIKTLDERGILQSVCSKNDFNSAAAKLKEFGIFDYFLYPQISWNSKSEGIKSIQKSLNIAMKTFAFVDDQEFEREEVKYALPEVRCLDAVEIPNILDMDMFMPKFITSDSKNRRMLYQNDIKRNKIQEEFVGTDEDFLRSLEMKFTVEKVKEDDLGRAEELTVRTHQLNATGHTYSYDELKAFSEDDNYLVLIAQLEDKYGTYGKIGLALIEIQEGKWFLRLMLMSCRVMSRGVGTVLLEYIARKAQENNVELYAEFVPTDVNRIMYITYKFAGFKKVGTEGESEILKADSEKSYRVPDYLTLVEGDK